MLELHVIKEVLDMSGPGLKHVDSHAAIHEAALNEARELNRLVAKLARAKRFDKAIEVAYIIVEHWETRTLQHAAAEEEGLYKDLLDENPNLKDEITALIRDHNMMRFLVKKIRQILETEGFTEEILELFYTLVHVDHFHNLQEEKLLPDH